MKRYREEKGRYGQNKRAHLTDEIEEDEYGEQSMHHKSRVEVDQERLTAIISGRANDMTRDMFGDENSDMYVKVLNRKMYRKIKDNFGFRPLDFSKINVAPANLMDNFLINPP